MSETVTRVKPDALERERRLAGRRPIVPAKIAIEEGVSVYLDAVDNSETIFYEPHFPEKSRVTDAYDNFRPEIVLSDHLKYDWWLLALMKYRGFIGDGNFEDFNIIEFPTELELSYAPRGDEVTIFDGTVDADAYNNNGPYGSAVVSHPDDTITAEDLHDW